MSDAGPHRYFHVDDLPRLLAERARREPPQVLVDLGAGDGATLYALDRAGLLPAAAIAVDLSRARVALSELVSPRIRGIVADATNVTELPDGCADAVVASQLIEHLEHDRALAPELARLLRPGGWFYVSSVLRGPHAWWIYRRDGRWLSDPTHVREYSGPDELRAALEHPDLVLDDVRHEPLRFPLADLALRAAAVARLVAFDQLPELYRRRPQLARLRALKVPVPGYRWLDATGSRRYDSAPARH